MLEWNEKFEIGHERIDFEHRIFLDLIFEFKRGIEKATDKAHQTRTLQEVLKYAEFHFVSEENIMIDHRYPLLDEHVAEHQMLLSRLQDSIYSYAHDTMSDEAVFNMLFSWFALHTTQEDKKIAMFLHESR